MQKARQGKNVHETAQCPGVSDNGAYMGHKSRERYANSENEKINDDNADYRSIPERRNDRQQTNSQHVIYQRINGQQLKQKNDPSTYCQGVPFLEIVQEILEQKKNTNYSPSDFFELTFFNWTHSLTSSIQNLERGKLT